MTPRAQDRVIATPELLELILTQLPMRNLLIVAPLVSKTWQTTTHTPTLQRALFFLPDPSSEPTQNPLLAELFSPFFAAEFGGESQCCNAETIRASPWAKAPDAFKRADASWRRMLLTQPPVRTMAITETRAGQWSGGSRRQAILKDPEALRMGVLYDLVVQLINGRSCFFRIKWHGEDIESQGDLTLHVSRSSGGCVRGRQSNRQRWVDGRFQSDARNSVQVDFGEWEDRERPFDRAAYMRVLFSKS